MNQDFVIAFGKEAITVGIYLAGPALLIALVVGLLISIFQAVTQIQEMTLAIIPKIIAVIAIILILYPWLLNVASEYMASVFTRISPNQVTP